MYRVFENFVEQLSASVDAVDLHEAMASAAAGFDFPLFAYFSYPSASGQRPRLFQIIILDITLSPTALPQPRSGDPSRAARVGYF